MIFVVVLAVITFMIASSAAYFSVVGLASIFSGAVIPVVVMGISLEAGKLVAASFLYKFWDRITWLMRSYLIAAVLVLMVVTSTGIFGFLSQGYLSDAAPVKLLQQRVDMLTEKERGLTIRIKEINNQINQLPPDMVKGRVKLLDAFKEEIDGVNATLTSVEVEKRIVTNQLTEKQAHLGPIVYIAEVFGSSTDHATKWIILMLISVFDPLAVVLTLGVNIAFAKIQKDNVVVDEDGSIDLVIQDELNGPKPFNINN